MLKVTKFGGSSMADAGQYRKVRDIVLADPERRVGIVSAAGQRDSSDHKLFCICAMPTPSTAWPATRCSI